MDSQLKKIGRNTAAAIADQMTTLVCGMVLPRLIITQYGSAANGRVSSISNFLALFSMMEMGVGAVVRSALYEPLAQKDPDSISRILISSRRFFRKLGLLFSIYIAALMVWFPLAVDHSMGYAPTVILVGAMSFNAMSSYLFGIVYQQLLSADQRSYVQRCSNILVTVLHTVFSVLLIQLGAGLATVKLAAALVMLLKPLLLKLYVDRHYRLDFKLRFTNEPLKQKWNGLAQHIATYVLKHADVVILTCLSTLENVSVYYVYHLVTNALSQLMELVASEYSVFLGNLYAKGDKASLDRLFSLCEWFQHTAVTLLFSITSVMIVPFIKLYTRGAEEAAYSAPVFAALLVLANGIFCLAMPYNGMVLAAGHFRQTQGRAITEAALNVVISVLLVRTFGLVGVAIGTAAAMAYRCFYLVRYLRREILARPFTLFARNLGVDALLCACIIFTARFIKIPQLSWGAWIAKSAVLGVCALCECAVCNAAFNRPLVRQAINFLRKKN